MLAALALTVAVACTNPAPLGAGPSPPPSSPARRLAFPPSEPAPPKLEIVAPRSARRTVGRAVRDLREIGLWHRLTRDLYAVRLSVRTGKGAIPGDRHLADAAYSGLVDDHGSGSLCDVFLFARSILDDHRRQRRFYAAHRADRPSSLRVFWASVLAHELAHCSTRGQRGERWSEHWEERVRDLSG